MNKKKLVFISSIAAPYQIKFCYALQEFYDAEFWFYDSLGSRDSWWKIDLGEKCKLIPGIFYKKNHRYLTMSIWKMLNEFNPDIVQLGGFAIPSNFIAYLWAKSKGKRTIVFTERSRDHLGNLKKRNLTWRIIRYLYRNVDMVMVNAADTVPQFKEEFKFGNKVVESRYAADIDSYFEHDFRQPKKNVTLLFANRLIPIYNPIGALEIFNKLLEKHPTINLHMNASGELRQECETFIKEKEITNNVRFLDGIKSWDELNLEYKKSDILLFPATFSNGNFTIMEAMASGMGIVLSDKIMGVGKLIENEVNGFRLGLDIDTFVKACEEYILNPELLKEHAVKNREIVRPLGLSGTSEKYYNLINSI